VIGFVAGTTLRRRGWHGNVAFLSRERLRTPGGRGTHPRLTLVVAPAGAGKTSLLGEFASEAGARVAWVRLTPAEVTPRRFLRAIARSAGEDDWESVDEAVWRLERTTQQRLVIFLDDLQTIKGSASERELERLLDQAPRTVTFVAASRVRPELRLARLRASDDVVEIGADDLRFRSWEVERLFRQCYGEPLPPNDLAELTRRTEGWAAGLQLFHLATRGKSPSERRRILGSLGGRWTLVREYLAQNVLADLDDELREFLVETSVLTKLSGALCDALLGRSGSERLLAELEDRQVFTVAIDDGWFRYHEVLRTHLETAFVDRTDSERARAHYRAAASLYEAAAEIPEALRAYCRAQAWEDVERMLVENGERLARGQLPWMDLLPPALLADDPWLTLAVGRQEWASGRLDAAAAAYAAAAALFADPRGAEICRRERARVQQWREVTQAPVATALDLVRAATIRDPVSARRRAAALTGVDARLAGGFAALLSGDVDDAAALLEVALEDPDASAELAAVARLGVGIAGLLANDGRGRREIELAAEEAERLSLPWVARTARASLALGGDPVDAFETAAARVSSEYVGDVWGVHVAHLFEGLGALRAGAPATDSLESAVTGFRALGAGVLEAWARGALALAAAREGAADAQHAAVQAEVSARLVGSRSGQALAYLALACVANESDEYLALAREIAESSGLSLPLPTARRRVPPLEVRLFGGLAVVVDGKEIDLHAAKPQARRALRYLALHADKPVHRETLMELLWPGADPASATRSLHVLISSLRHVLEPGVARGRSRLIVREDEAYRLRVPPGARVDLAEFDEAVAAARRAQARGDGQVAAAEFDRALLLHSDDLLPEEGPADWAVEERDVRRAAAAEAAYALASILLASGQPLAAAAACERGLAIDRQADGLWRLCALAYERGRDAAAAARARAAYERMLHELGLVPALASV
jgi:DNA-binding SARP family transcriptional activator